MQTQRLVRYMLVAAAVGALAALPLVVLMLVVPAHGLLVVLWPIAAAWTLLCPPWEVFWGAMGYPDRLALAGLCATVVALNAAIYAPMGIVFFASRGRSGWRSAVVRWPGCVAILAIGHVLVGWAGRL